MTLGMAMRCVGLPAVFLIRAASPVGLTGVRAREFEGLPPDSGKTVIFRAEANQSAAKNENFLYLLNENKTGVHFIERDSAQNPGFLLMIIGWGESGKVILQVSTQHSSSFWHCRDTFRAKTAQRTQRKLAGTPDEA